MRIVDLLWSCSRSNTHHFHLYCYCCLWLTLAHSSEGLSVSKRSKQVYSNPDSPKTVASVPVVTFFGDKLCSKHDGEVNCHWLLALDVTRFHIKMVDDTDNKKKLEIPPTELLVCLSGTHILRYGDFHHYYCFFKSHLNRLFGKIFITDITDRRVRRTNQLLNPVSAHTVRDNQ